MATNVEEQQLINDAFVAVKRVEIGCAGTLKDAAEIAGRIFGRRTTVPEPENAAPARVLRLVPSKERKEKR